MAIEHTSYTGALLSRFRISLIALASVGVSGAALAVEDQSYTALRAWIDQNPPAAEMLTAGQHLTIDDRKTLIEPLIPQSAWEYYLFDDMDMEVAATGNYPAPPEWGQNITTDHRLDADGVLVGFTGGGFPFEQIDENDPQAAQKVIWNMLWKPGASDYFMPMVTWLRSENGQTDRVLEMATISSTYARGDHCLVPGYEEVKSKQILEFRSPRDMAGTKTMTIAYVDHRKENSGWMYMSSQRKPRRTLASERTGELLGMDMIQEDVNGFDGKIHENSWTYLGKRKVLATVNIRDNPEMGGPHRWVPHKTRWEIRDQHVIMTEPKAGNHPYSHRVIFIDAETFWTSWMFAFDRDNKQLLRMNQHYTKYSETYATEPATQAPYVNQDFSTNIGHHVFLHLGETDIDAVKPHATITHCYVAKKDFTAPRAKQFFSLRNMVSGRR